MWRKIENSLWSTVYHNWLTYPYVGLIDLATALILSVLSSLPSLHLQSPFLKTRILEPQVNQLRQFYCSLAPYPWRGYCFGSDVYGPVFNFDDTVLRGMTGFVQHLLPRQIQMVQPCMRSWCAFEADRNLLLIPLAAPSLHDRFVHARSKCLSSAQRTKNSSSVLKPKAYSDSLLVNEHIGSLLHIVTLISRNF